VQARLKGILHRRPGVALGLWGEAGVGKTHAAEGILRRLPCKSLRLHATTALGELARMPRPTLADWAEENLRRMAEGGDPFVPGGTEALTALLTQIAPVVVHLEDLHEASPKAQEAYGSLARMVGRVKGVALLATGRAQPPEPFVSFRLEPLEAAASRALLEGEVAAPLPQAATDWIYARASGNPLFTLEYLRHLARAGHLWNDGHSWRWRDPPQDRMPLTVEALIERQLLEAADTEAARRALEARAILPPKVSRALWAEVAGLDEAELGAALQTLERQNLLRHGEFVHPLFREVRLGTLRPERKQVLARRAIEALRDDPQAAALYVEDAGLEPAQALRLLLWAAEKAKQAGNELGSARFMAQAARYAGDPGPLAFQAAKTLQHHDLQGATRLAQLALDSGGATAETVQLYAHLQARQGRLPDLSALLLRLPEGLRKTVEPHGLALTTLHQAGDNRAALEVWETHPELHQGATPELLHAAAASALALGRMELVGALIAQAQAAPKSPEIEAELRFIEALTHYHQGDYAAAEAVVSQALTLLEGLKAPRLRATALLNRAAFLRMLGRYGEMDACLEEALRIRRRAGDAKAYAFALAALSELRVEQGRYEEAEEAITEAIGALELYGPSRFLTNAHSMASLLYRSQDTPLARLLALKHADQALGYARALGNPRAVREILFDASLAYTRAGYAQRGLEFAAEAQGLAEAAGNSPNDEFHTLWAKGMALAALGEREAAIAALREAQALARELKVEIDEHKLGLELDRLTGNVESARQRLEWFESRGLMNGANLARRLFPELAEAAPSVQPQQKLEGIRAADGVQRRLEVLGPVQFAGEPLRGRKRQELMALLLEARLAGRGEVGKLELLEALYPGEDEEKAASSLKELVRTVRSALGAAAISTTSAGYALGGAITSDVEAFLREGDLRLWRGAYLEGLNSSNETVRDSVHLALRSRAEAMLGTDPKEAERAGRILLEAEPYDLEVLRLTLEALRRAGNHKSLGRVYEEAKARMLEVGEQLTWEMLGLQPSKGGRYSKSE